ncbi:MAG: pitrilysin family protein [bacterium]
MINLSSLIKYKLSNGLQVILYPDINFPLVSTNLWYKVGSANEIPGKSGLAHLAEHLMFQGSLNVPKEAHFKYIEEAGGSLNGSTNKERTNYYETLPSNHLELAFWLESDRMGYLLQALDDDKFNNQLSVVINERKERYDNEPYGKAGEIIYSNIYSAAHPYFAPVIGWQDDLDNLTIDDAKEFIKTYYSPNNASLVVAGDFDLEETKTLIEKYFGNIPPAKNIPQIIFPSVSLTETKCITHYDKVNLPKIYLAWITDPSYSDEDFALSLSSFILGNSRTKYLFKKLVYDKQVAVNISCSLNSYKNSGVFLITATAHKDGNLDELKNLIFEEIEELKKNSFSQKELNRFINLYTSHTLFSLQNLANIADNLNGYDFELGTPDGFDFEIEKFRSLTPEIVGRFTSECLSKPYIELRILPLEENIL